MSKKCVKRNERLESIFNKVAKDYDSIGPGYFSYFGERLVEGARMKEGAHVLDVACGRGASIVPASKNVGIKGKVVGIDFSEEMINETGKMLCNECYTNVQLIQMDAERIDFTSGYFDNVLCGLSLGFFRDSIGAIREMYRVMKKGGTLGLSSWKKKNEKCVMDKVYCECFPEGAQRNLRNKEGRPDFGSAEGIELILKEIGFKNIEVILEDRIFYYKDEEEWWDEQWTNASRGLFEYVESKGELKRFKEVAFREIKKFKEENGIKLKADVLITYAKK